MGESQGPGYVAAEILGVLFSSSLIIFYCNKTVLRVLLIWAGWPGIGGSGLKNLSDRIIISDLTI